MMINYKKQKMKYMKQMIKYKNYKKKNNNKI